MISPNVKKPSTWSRYTYHSISRLKERKNSPWAWKIVCILIKMAPASIKECVVPVCLINQLNLANETQYLVQRNISAAQKKKERVDDVYLKLVCWNHFGGLRKWGANIVKCKLRTGPKVKKKPFASSSEICRKQESLSWKLDFNDSNAVSMIVRCIDASSF